jgi:signal peptidase I
MSRFVRFIGAIVSTCAIIFGLFIIVDTYVAGIIKVDDAGIVGLIEADDVVIVDKLSQNFKTLARFDFIVFRHPTTGKVITQRIIGLPGEKVDYLQNQLFINNTQIEEPFLTGNNTGAQQNSFSGVKILPDSAGVLPPQQYIVINDNRHDEDDSRTFGALGQEHIVGVIKARVFPFHRLSLL